MRQHRSQRPFVADGGHLDGLGDNEPEQCEDGERRDDGDEYGKPIRQLDLQGAPHERRLRLIGADERTARQWALREHHD